MFNYTLQELNKIAKDNKFVRDTLEKVLRLSDILEIFNTNSMLKNNYVLKGGTAINLCIFDFPRLSVDIDMNFNSDCNREEMMRLREIHKELIKALMMNEGYTIGDNSRYSHSLDSYLLKYTNAVGNPDNIKIEINYSNRVQIIEPVQYNISTKIIENRKVLGSDLIELYGSKIAALIGRTTARDLYDVYKMIHFKIVKKSKIDLLRKCAIFYLILSNDNKTIPNLLNDFNTNLQNITTNNIKRNLIPVLHTDEHISLEEMKETVLKYITELLILTENENKFVNEFNNKNYDPNLLFDKETANRIHKHPMALWKTKQ